VAQTQNVGTRTVRDVIDKANEIFFGKSSPDGSYFHSDEQWAFKHKLFGITRERKTKEIAECDDIDATAFLNEDEYNALIKEAESLKK
jgi:hypothetical protein